jgi:uncharacterized protein (TIGR02145 family)
MKKLVLILSLFYSGIAFGQAEVTIGTQVWMKENLNVSTFQNGDTIPEIKTGAEWEKAGKEGKPAWCYYNNDPANGAKYGKLYNWFALIDKRGLAPKGWRIPNDSDWTVLLNNYPDSIVDNKLKSTSGWAKNGNGDNGSGFSALPGGVFVGIKGFYQLGTDGYFWSSTEQKRIAKYDDQTAHCIQLSSTISDDRIILSEGNKACGESVRCLKKKQ